MVLTNIVNWILTQLIWIKALQNLIYYHFDYRKSLITQTT